MADLDEAQRLVDELRREARKRWGKVLKPRELDPLMAQLRRSMADLPTIGHYILNSHHDPIRVRPDEWAVWFETADRTVAKDVLPDGTEISTVFLGIDHNLWAPGPALLYETAVFKTDGDVEIIDRNATWEGAEALHARMVDRARKLLTARRLVDDA